MGNPLPVLPFGPYRRYPTRASRQGAFDDDHEVCAHCLSGTCCSSEDPVALTSFDVLRLAAFFDMSPAEFLLGFTQDRFAGEPNDERRRPWIESPESSVVTFLRRRAEHPTSPCIFLKYVRDDDGTPRRVCSVHPARPLACREYYYDTCKKRVTGELAVVQAEGLEMVRDGTITTELVEANCKRLEPVADHDPVAKKWQYAFWSEMRRALDIERANNEGAAGYPISQYQDPLEEKLNRLLSTRYLRFEEKYGPEPHSEQLQPYAAGLSFKDSPDYERILRIIRTAPAEGLFARQDYPHYVGVRALMPGVRMADDFGRARLPTTRGEPYASAIARGWNFLLGLAAHALRTDPLLELEVPGAFELAFLEALLPFSEAVQRRVEGTACLTLANRWAGTVAVRVLQASCESLAASHASPKAWMQLYCSVACFDSGASPRRLRDLVRALRAETARRLPASWRRTRSQRVLRPAAPPRTPESWAKLSDWISALRASDVIGLADQSARVRVATLERLEQIAFSESPPAWTFEALDAFVRAGRRLPSSVRRRAADLALRWAARTEEQDFWERDLLLRWASLSARLGIAGSNTPGLSRSLEHILSSQNPDGSWATDLQPGELPDSQGDYLAGAVRATSSALEGLCAALSLLDRGR